MLCTVDDILLNEISMPPLSCPEEEVNSQVQSLPVIPESLPSNLPDPAIQHIKILIKERTVYLQKVLWKREGKVFEYGWNVTESVLEVKMIKNRLQAGMKGLQGAGVCPQTWAEREASLPAGDPEEEFYLPELSLAPEVKQKYYDFLYHYFSFKNGIEKHLIHIPDDDIKEIREKHFDLYKKIVIRRDRITVFLNDLLKENITSEEFTVCQLKKLLQDLFKHYCSVNNAEYLKHYKAPEQTEFF